MEGALGERLKRDYGLLPHPNVALAIHGITEAGRTALKDLWTEYASIAIDHGLLFLDTTPTRRAKGISGPGLPPQTKTISGFAGRCAAASHEFGLYPVPQPVQ